MIELRATTNKTIQVLMNEKNACVGTIHRINAELTKRQSAEAHRVAVTDHAVVRYLERIDGLDLEGVRQKITEMARRAIRRDDQFLHDPITGMVLACRRGSDSIATILPDSIVDGANQQGAGQNDNPPIEGEVTPEIEAWAADAIEKDKRQ